jgi:hypothetical protein
MFLLQGLGVLNPPSEYSLSNRPVRMLQAGTAAVPGAGPGIPAAPTQAQPLPNPSVAAPTTTPAAAAPLTPPGTAAPVGAGNIVDGAAPLAPAPAPGASIVATDLGSLSQALGSAGR